jgi:hypothetical protein
MATYTGKILTPEEKEMRISRMSPTERFYLFIRLMKLTKKMKNATIIYPSTK